MQGLFGRISGKTKKNVLTEIFSEISQPLDITEREMVK